MTKSFLTARSLTAWDKISILIYVVLSVVLWIYFTHIEDYQSKRSLLLAYSLGTQVCLYVFNFRSLRNLTSYGIWLFIGLLHLVAYFHFKRNPLLSNVRGHAATGLRNTLPLLLLFQVLRALSLRFQNRELVAPSKSTTDIFDERRVNFFDFMLFFVYFIGMIILLFN